MNVAPEPASRVCGKPAVSLDDRPDVPAVVEYLVQDGWAWEACSAGAITLCPDPTYPYARFQAHGYGVDLSCVRLCASGQLCAAGDVELAYAKVWRNAEPLSPSLDFFEETGLDEYYVSLWDQQRLALTDRHGNVLELARAAGR